MAGTGIYRIIGNCIPGLHGPHRSWINLALILCRESAFKGADKWVIINRIVDETERQRVIQLLKAHAIPYIEIAFDASAYARIGYDLKGLPNSYFWFKRTGPWNRMFRNTAVRTFKNAYLMNNNGARNLALTHGRKRYRWILPWDGNCFIPDACWAQLEQAFNHQGEHKYVITPMQRASEELSIGPQSVADQATEEPQVSFRNDAAEAFNEARVYGYQPKLELLKRLGEPDSLNKKKDLYPWQDLIYTPSPEQGEFLVASSVFRLYSGNAETVTDGPNRSFTRGNGIIELIDEVDARCLANRLVKLPDLSAVAELIVDSKHLHQCALEADSVPAVWLANQNPTDVDVAVQLVYWFTLGKLKATDASALLYQRFIVPDNPDLGLASEVLGNLSGVLSMLVTCLACETYTQAIRYQLDAIMLFYHFMDNRTRLKGAMSEMSRIEFLWNVSVLLLGKVSGYDLPGALQQLDITTDVFESRYGIRSAFGRYLALSSDNTLMLSPEPTDNLLYVSDHLQKANGRRIRYVLDDLKVRVNLSSVHEGNDIEIKEVANGFLIKRGQYYLSDIRGKYLRWEDHPRDWEVFSLALL